MSRLFYGSDFCIDGGPSVEKMLLLEYSTGGPIIGCGILGLMQLVVRQVSLSKGKSGVKIRSGAINCSRVSLFRQLPKRTDFRSNGG